MYKVYKNVEMTKEGYLFGIENKEASEKCAPGQYFELKLSGDDHRVPTILTDILSERGIIKVVFRPINDTTRAMARFHDGDYVDEVYGPYGKKCPFLEKDMEGKKVLVVAEDLAGAQAYMLIHDIKKKGAVVDAVAGGRTKGCLYLSEFTGELCRTYLNYSEDGTQGEEGTICDKIEEILSRDKYDMCVVLGMIDTMEYTVKKAMEKNIETWVSLDPTITAVNDYFYLQHVVINGETIEICKEGTLFRAENINFDELRNQLQR